MEVGATAGASSRGTPPAVASRRVAGDNSFRPSLRRGIDSDASGETRWLAPPCAWRDLVASLMALRLGGRWRWVSRSGRGPYVAGGRFLPRLPEVPPRSVCVLHSNSSTSSRCLGRSDR
jgi:hypothetical protein